MAQLINSKLPARLVRVRWQNSTWRPRVTVVPYWHRLAKLGVRPARVVYRSMAISFSTNRRRRSLRVCPVRAGLIRLRRVLAVNGASTRLRNGVTRHLHVRITPSPEPRFHL